jgi:hypothetical protein
MPRRTRHVAGKRRLIEAYVMGRRTVRSYHLQLEADRLDRLDRRQICALYRYLAEVAKGWSSWVVMPGAAGLRIKTKGGMHFVL